MHVGKGQILELILRDGFRLARLACPQAMIPAPGQYLLAGDASDATLGASLRSPLPVPLFHADSAPQGFLVSPPIPDFWMPGTEVFLRGLLGHGFVLPPSARKVGLVAFDHAPSRLLGLVEPALKQSAAVVLVSNFASDHLPDEVEVQPLSAVAEIIEWADYVAIDVARENLSGLRERLGSLKQASVRGEAQVLIRTPVPCGGIAECGVCAVNLKSGWRLACKDGPVFDGKEI